MYEWHEKQYYGAAHGVSGIHFILMLAKDFIEEEDLINLIQPSIDALAKHFFPSGNFPSSYGLFSNYPIHNYI